jgi:hypothetical protein
MRGRTRRPLSLEGERRARDGGGTLILEFGEL